MSAHTCHANGCEARVPPRMFMCRPHWCVLPKATRDEVLAAYTPGQERDWSKVTDHYLNVTLDAIEWLDAQLLAGGEG